MAEQDGILRQLRMAVNVDEHIRCHNCGSSEFIYLCTWIIRKEVSWKEYSLKCSKCNLDHKSNKILTHNVTKRNYSGPERRSKTR